MSHFNFIITVHNAEAHIEDVIRGVFGSLGPIEDHILIVCDGCTDKTEKIIDPWRHEGPVITKIITADVHELLSINAGLRAADQSGDGYNIILQDDVILEDPDIEEKVQTLYETVPNLGYVSFRLGFNIGSPDLTAQGYFHQTDEIESAYGAGVCGGVLLPGRFAARTVPIKSPVCLPCKLVREVGLLNEDLAPYGYDDLDYAIRTTMAGYVNGVFGIKFRSDVRWGGTRKPGHPDIQPTARRNAAIIREKYVKELRAIVDAGQPQGSERIIPSSIEENEAAMEAWCASKDVLAGMNA